MRLFLGPALALVATAAAAAHDYVVVASSDPAIPRGQAVDAGARLPLASGRTVTLMYASGDLVTLKGASGGVVAPSRQANSTQAQRLAVLRMMLAPEATSGSGGKLTKARGGICPAPASLSTLDDIAGVAEAGCADEARAAFEAWLAAHPAS
ncbi:MAG TPA: hypothetical protein VFH92_10545, partial [Phenylobacterium sp.]|nr:hypothetical protein [Phenylobacterium sp.]